MSPPKSSTQQGENEENSSHPIPTSNSDPNGGIISATTPTPPPVQTCNVSLPLSPIDENLCRQLLSSVGRQTPVPDPAQLQGATGEPSQSQPTNEVVTTPEDSILPISENPYLQLPAHHQSSIQESMDLPALIPIAQSLKRGFHQRLARPSNSYGRICIYRPTLRSVATQTDELESIVISDEDEPQKDVVIVISDDESDVEGIS